MSEINEALVVLCKCGEVHRAYGMRAERTGKERWRFTWAFPIKESSARREGYDKTVIGGDVAFAEEYPGCPYCGQSSFTLCSCGHLSCNILRDGIFTCEWCGMQSRVEAYCGEEIKAGADL